MRIILVRHGETERNREKRLQGGFADIDLNETGREQARAIASALEGEEITALYSSPLKRTRHTAQPIAETHHLEVNIEPNLREINAGDIDGLSMEEMSREYEDFYKEWMLGKGSVRMPGGESLEELQHRAWGAVQDIMSRHQGTTVAVVSHNLVILAVICRSLGLDIAYFRKLRQDVAAISILDFGGRGASLALLNDTCHLR
jgi:probable phosphoglycerate mutase